MVVFTLNSQQLELLITLTFCNFPGRFELSGVNYKYKIKILWWKARKILQVNEKTYKYIELLVAANVKYIVTW